VEKAVNTRAATSPDEPGERYRLSFTAGGLLAEETGTLAKAYLASGDWGTVRRQIVECNLLGYKTVNTAARIGSEIEGRLKELAPGQLERLAGGLAPERKVLAWVAVCRRYSLVAEFAREVVRERHLAGGGAVGKGDWAVFYERKAATHPELTAVSPKTQEKIRQVVFRMLLEAGILGKDGIIQSAWIPEDTYALLARSDALCFPLYLREG
jgi:hypothetical protein